ncbi:MAG: hypothetical protein AB4426_02485 [Xenococcaceae cyanobacterium]
MNQFFPQVTGEGKLSKYKHLGKAGSPAHIGAVLQVAKRNQIVTVQGGVIADAIGNRMETGKSLAIGNRMETGKSLAIGNRMETGKSLAIENRMETGKSLVIGNRMETEKSLCRKLFCRYNSEGLRNLSER